MRPQTVTNDEILTVSHRLFLEHGINTSVQQIADELGISQPALFKRFGTKRNLMIEALRPSQPVQLFALLQQTPNNRPFKEQFIDVAKELLLTFREINPTLRVIQSSDITMKELMDHLDAPVPIQILRYLAQWLEACCNASLIRNVDYELTAMTILGAFQIENFKNICIGDEAMNAVVAVTDEDMKFFDGVISLLWQGLKNDA